MSNRNKFFKSLSVLVYIAALVNVALVTLFTMSVLSTTDVGVFGGISVLGALIIYAILGIWYKPWIIEVSEHDLESIQEATEQNIVCITPQKPFVVKEATPITMEIQNPSNAFGVRIRFYTTDHVSPRSVDLNIEVGAIADLEVHLIPLLPGDRQVAIEFAPLFDANGQLIPGTEADQIVTHRFKYVARESSIVGITSSQMNTLKNLLKVATGIILVAGFVTTLMPELVGGFEEAIRTFIPLLITLQVPILFLHFALQNRLPK